MLNINREVYNPQELQQTIKLITKGLVGRDQLAELIVLAMIAQEHLLVIGPPGTAKSAVVRRMAKAMEGKYFEYLLGRFTEPAELFGAVDLKKLREGLVEIDTQGMLPDADIVFLDEVFLGSTAILNTLLGILNERVFRKGHTQIDCPLKICIGASNSLPDEEMLSAFADRFLIHLFIDGVENHLIEDMLKGGWLSERLILDSAISLNKISALSSELNKVQLDEIIPVYAQALRILRQNNIILSDRRAVKTLKLIAAAALVNGRYIVQKKDLWPLIYVLPTREIQQQGQVILKEFLAEAQNTELFNAVEMASLQPLSRKERLLSEARNVLEKTDRLNVEAVLREIDANYSDQTMPLELKEIRQQLIGLVLSNG